MNPAQLVDEHLDRTESIRPEELAPLTRADRCDNGGCAAAAVVRALIPYERGGSGQLDFCDHHYRLNQGHLLEIAGAVRDERAELAER